MLKQLLQSSADPKKVSLTVKAAVPATVAVIMLVIRLLGSQVSQDEVYVVVTSVSEAVSAFAAFVAAVMAAYGLVRKLYRELLEALKA